MKKIGLLGGMSWESTGHYYRLINEEIKRRLGGLHSAEIILYSVDFDPIEKLQHKGDWPGTEKLLLDAARSIEKAGADCLLICTNTMHKVAPAIEEALEIPLLHIADAAGEALTEKGVVKAGLLGTAFTMEEEFYRKRLEEKYGLEIIVPEQSDRQLIHRVIYDELCLGTIRQESAAAYYRIIDQLAGRGAQGVVLGCTEIGLLVSSDFASVPLFDTTVLHARKAVDFALSE